MKISKFKIFLISAVLVFIASSICQANDIEKKFVEAGLIMVAFQWDAQRRSAKEV